MCWTTGENIAAERKVCLEPTWNCWACLCYTFMFFWVKTLFFSDKQTVYPGVSVVFPPLCSHAAREGRVWGIVSFKSRAQKRVDIYLYKLIFIRLRCRPQPLMLHFAGELQRLCWVRCCIFDKHHTSQMFTKDVCQRVFVALTKSLEIWYVGLVDVFQPSGKC